MTEWTQSIVAFLDILGYKDLIKKDVHEQSGIYKQIYAVIQKAPSYTSLPELDVHQFSDSIVIRTDFKNKKENLLEIVKATKKIQIEFLKIGILLRGAISNGMHFSKKDFIYSEGLVSAYQKESNYAKFPRVIVDENTFLLFDEMDSLKRNKMFRTDNDQMVFVDYLNSSTVKKAFDIIKNRGDRLNTSSYEKFLWLANYSLLIESGKDIITLKD